MFKIGMIGVGVNFSEKFIVVWEVGFVGVEMNLFGMNVEEMLKVIKDLGILVDGMVCLIYWLIWYMSDLVEWCG